MTVYQRHFYCLKNTCTNKKLIWIVICQIRRIWKTRFYLFKLAKACYGESNQLLIIDAIEKLITINFNLKIVTCLYSKCRPDLLPYYLQINILQNKNDPTSTKQNKNKKLTRLDKTPSIVLKKRSVSTAPFMFTIFPYCLLNTHFLTKQRCAQITPVLKKECPLLSESCSTIPTHSLLPKILRMRRLHLSFRFCIARRASP